MGYLISLPAEESRGEAMNQGMPHFAQIDASELSCLDDNIDHVLVGNRLCLAIFLDAHACLRWLVVSVCRLSSREQQSTCQLHV